MYYCTSFLDRPIPVVGVHSVLLTFAGHAGAQVSRANIISIQSGNLANQLALLSEHRCAERHDLFCTVVQRTYVRVC